MILNVNDFDYNLNLFELLNNYFDITPTVVLTALEIGTSFLHSCRLSLTAATASYGMYVYEILNL